MKVRVRNFQTAKDSSVEIKGFTVVVGKSNTGKTSILRAVEASMFNDSITGCVRYGEKDAIVDVELDGFAYTWEKGETKNGYSVTTPDGKKEYSKVGFQRPDEFDGAGFREFRIDGEQYPIRPQFAEWHSPIFLLNKTGKVITELMASVTRLDVINMSIRKCSTNLRRDRSTLKVREDDLKKMKRRSIEYDALDDIEMPKIEALYKECQALEASLEQVDRYVGRLESLQGTLAQFEEVPNIVVPPPVPASDQAKIREVDGYIQKLLPIESTLAQLEAVDQITVPSKVPSDLQARVREVEGYIQKMAPLTQALSAVGMLDEVVVPAAIPAADLDGLRRVAAWVTNMDSLSGRLRATDGVDSIVVPTHNLKEGYATVATVEGFLASLLKCGRDVATAKTEVEEIETALRTDEAEVAKLRNQIKECPVCGRADHV